MRLSRESIGRLRVVSHEFYLPTRQPTIRNITSRCPLTPNRDNNSRNARGDSFPHTHRFFKRLIAIKALATLFSQAALAGLS